MTPDLQELKADWPKLDANIRRTRLAAFINAATDLHSISARAFLADVLRELPTAAGPFLDARARELNTFSDLPGEFHLYRGAHSDAGAALPSGVCWTRHESVAKEYARGFLVTRPRIKREELLGILCDGKHETLVYRESEPARLLTAKWPSA